MDTFLTVTVIIILVLAAVLVLMYFLGSRAQKKQAEQQEMMAAMAQNVSMLVIDKKKLKIKDAGMPKQVYENTPKYMRWMKMPVVKAKVGPRVMTFLCDAEAYEQIPVKQEVKAVISGLYITKVKSIRGSLVTPPKKRGLRARLRRWASEKSGGKTQAPAKSKKK